MKEFENKKIDDLELFRKFLKLFVTDEQIRDAKKCYEEINGRNSYAEEVESIADIDANLDVEAEGLIHLAENIAEAMEGLIDAVNSGVTFESAHYQVIALAMVTIDCSSKKLGKQIIKKIREKFGTWEKLSNLFQDKNEDVATFYELLTGNKRPDNIKARITKG